MPKTRTPRNAPNTPNAPAAPSVAPTPPGPSPAAPVPPELPLPHERDQALGHSAHEPDPLIERAAKDLDEGQVDTDLRNTPGLDAQRRERMVRTPPPRKR